MSEGRGRRTPSGTVAGATATLERVVGSQDTAAALGSEELPVLATPRMLAWCEAATCAAVTDAGGGTSVGTRLRLEHVAASLVGARVRVAATVVAVDGRLLTFEVVAYDIASDRMLVTARSLACSSTAIASWRG